MSVFKTVNHKADLCVVGGGLAGMCAAIAAARHGTSVVLMQDRPVLGGNASSEAGVSPIGAFGSWDKSVRETGIVEELYLDNFYLNPYLNWSIWDGILYGKVRYQKSITLLLNCSCNAGRMAGNRLASITGWQTTTQTWHTVEAKYFADCSGDSVLAPITGAEFRMGREGRKEFGESAAFSEEPNNWTMGMSVLVNFRYVGHPVKFTPPSWAYTFERDEDMPKQYRGKFITEKPEGSLAWDSPYNGPWSMYNSFYVELGAKQDTIHDTEEIKDELLKIAFGIVDHYKNKGDHNAENIALERITFLPGKRASRRYVGDYILTQKDLESGGHFDDIVAYGGWVMDDHHPDGFHIRGETKELRWTWPSIPYGVPYRCVYSRNIENLFCAGRNISVSHVALTSTRVLATCALLGQAVGTAASIASEHKLSPRDVGKEAIKDLQNHLMEDDVWLPGRARPIPDLTRRAKLSSSSGNADPLRNGIDRQSEGKSPIEGWSNGPKSCGVSNEIALNGWVCGLGDWAEYRFDKLEKIQYLRFVFDSDLKRPCNNTTAGWFLPDPISRIFPPTMLKGFRVDALEQNGQWREVLKETNNYQRLARYDVAIETKAIRFYPEETWGNGKVTVFSWDVC